MIQHRLGLLLIPFVALLAVPLYNLHDPVLFGFPFFYWYQFAWLPLISAQYLDLSRLPGGAALMPLMGVANAADN
jgi:uncharacterized protein DUF3311